MPYIISGRFKNKKLVAPKSDLTRPTTSKLRESLFNICQSYIEDALFLDVFAGSGSMGIEALSRGAKSSVFIDSSKESMKCIKQNLETIEAQKEGFFLLGDAFLMLQKLIKQDKHFTIIYMDPPYGDGSLSNQFVQLIDESSLLEKEGMLFIEDGKLAAIKKHGWQTLELVSDRNMGKSQLLQFKKTSLV